MSESDFVSETSHRQLLVANGKEILYQLRVGPSSLPEAGAGLFAENNISTAQDVICKRQFLLVADKNHLPSTCDYCLLWLGSSITQDGRMKSAGDAEPVLKKCGGCKVVRYCGKTCQQKAWKSHHKAECSVLEQHGEIADVILHATVRLILCRSAGNVAAEAWDSFMELDSHRSNYFQSPRHLREPMEYSILKAREWTQWNDEDGSLQEIYCRIKLNCMALDHLDAEHIGICLDPLVATFNHSCKPNTNPQFEGNTIRLRSVRPIRRNEEVTLSYCDFSMDYHSRQRVLRDKWFFNCRCNTCEEETGKDPSLLSSTANLQSTDKLLEIFSTFNFREPEKAEKAISELPARHQNLSSLRAVHTSLALGYRAKTDLLSELRHWLMVCYVCDAKLYRNCKHHNQVQHLYLLAILLHKIVFAKKNADALPELDFDGLELGNVYKYTLMQVAEDAQITFGERSMLAIAAASRIDEDAMLTGRPSLVKELMRLPQWQAACNASIAKLLTWAGIAELK